MRDQRARHNAASERRDLRGLPLSIRIPRARRHLQPQRHIRLPILLRHTGRRVSLRQLHLLGPEVAQLGNRVCVHWVQYCGCRAALLPNQGEEGQWQDDGREDEAFLGIVHEGCEGGEGGDGEGGDRGRGAIGNLISCRKTLDATLLWLLV